MAWTLSLHSSRLYHTQFLFAPKENNTGDFKFNPHLPNRHVTRTNLVVPYGYKQMLPLIHIWLTIINSFRVLVRNSQDRSNKRTLPVTTFPLFLAFPPSLPGTCRPTSGRLVLATIRLVIHIMHNG